MALPTLCAPSLPVSRAVPRAEELLVEEEPILLATLSPELLVEELLSEDDDLTEDEDLSEEDDLSDLVLLTEFLSEDERLDEEAPLTEEDSPLLLRLLS